MELVNGSVEELQSLVNNLKEVNNDIAKMLNQLRDNKFVIRSGKEVIIMDYKSFLQITKDVINLNRNEIIREIKKSMNY